MHQSFFLVCPDWSKRIDFYFKRQWAYISFGQIVLIVPAEKSNPESDPGGWIVQAKAKISCDTADQILSAARADANDPPDYNVIHDCHWYNRRLFNMGSKGVTECPD